MGGTRIAVLFLALHLIAAWYVDTAFVPDEFWQCLEVAHRLVFGYGAMTWEWAEGIRSFIYPGMVAILYKALALFELDSVLMLTVGPRVLQAIISTVADFKFWKWCSQQTGCRGQWAVFSLVTSWFWIYCGSRTLSNTFETAITMMALQAFPWSEKGRKDGSLCYLWYVALMCIARPTAVIIWIPLVFYHFITTSRKCLFIMKGTVIMFVVMTILIVIDTLCYKNFMSTPWNIPSVNVLEGGDSIFGTFTATITAIKTACIENVIFTPWNFVKFNVLEGVSSSYGTHPHHWYLSQGFPVIMGLHIIPFLLGVWKTIQARWRDVETPLLCVILWTIFVYSLMPHKEFRFILPLLPMALYISSAWLSRWSRTAHETLLWLSALLLLAGGIIPSFYFGTIHQQGTIKVMPVLAEAAAKSSNTSILYLMPCHSTPFYSHVHVDIPMRFLTCQPNFEHLENYIDEADKFYSDPMQWLEAEFPAEAALPTHIVAFDAVHGDIQRFLKQRGYKLKLQMFHATDLLRPARVEEKVMKRTSGSPLNKWLTTLSL